MSLPQFSGAAASPYVAGRDKEIAKLVVNDPERNDHERFAVKAGENVRGCRAGVFCIGPASQARAPFALGSGKANDIDARVKARKRLSLAIPFV